MSIARAWIVLVVLSLATTALAVLHAEGTWTLAALFALALGKSAVILSDYLRLSQAPSIRRGFYGAFLIWAMIALVLALAA